MKRFIALFAALVLALFIAPDSSAVSKGGITVHNWSLTSIRPTSFTSVDGVVTLTLSSTRRRTVISDITGTIYKKDGQAFIIGRADNLTIQILHQSHVLSIILDCFRNLIDGRKYLLT